MHNLGTGMERPYLIARGPLMGQPSPMHVSALFSLVAEDSKEQTPSMNGPSHVLEWSWHGPGYHWSSTRGTQIQEHLVLKCVKTRCAPDNHLKMSILLLAEVFHDFMSQAELCFSQK